MSNNFNKQNMNEYLTNDISELMNLNKIQHNIDHKTSFTKRELKNNFFIHLNVVTKLQQFYFRFLLKLEHNVSMAFIVYYETNIDEICIILARKSPFAKT